MRAATGSAPCCGPPRQSGTPAVPTARDGPSDAQQPRASRRAAAFSLEKLAHRRHVEHLLGKELLQLAIFVLQRFQPLGVRHRHPGIVRRPGLERAFRHPVLGTEISALRASLVLLQDANDLLFCQLWLLHRPSSPWVNSNRRWRKNLMANQLTNTINGKRPPRVHRHLMQNATRSDDQRYFCDQKSKKRFRK